MKYGSVRRWVEGLTMVTADAEVVRLDRGVKPADSAMAQVFRQIKRAFDPSGVLNPGVKFDFGAGEPPIRSLKVGSRAAPIPADIAAGLRRLEQGAGYDSSRLDLADDPL
ncbi:MAG: FAD-binding oxidoreductase [Gemmatimonadetes bacterium]|nr:FAD-binding oxidoreductase [Gemmatimonadota bacterium]